MIARIAAIALLCAAPVFADVTDIGTVRLTGNVWADGARDDIAGRAMVCALAGPASFLSLRVDGASDAKEVLKLSPMAIVELTGETSPDRAWAEVSGVQIEMAMDGTELPAQSQTQVALHGWVHTRYLCNYFY